MFCDDCRPKREVFCDDSRPGREVFCDDSRPSVAPRDAHQDKSVRSLDCYWNCYQTILHIDIATRLSYISILLPDYLTYRYCYQTILHIDIATRLSYISMPKGGTKWSIINIDDDNGWCAPMFCPRPFWYCDTTLMNGVAWSPRDESVIQCVGPSYHNFT